MHNKNFLFLAACLAMLLFGIACVAIGTINEYLTSSFSVDKIFIGFLASLFAAGALIGSLSFGPIVDRFGYKIIMVVSLMFLLTAFEIIARTNQLIIIRAMIFLLGLGGGIINGAASALVADLFTEKKGAYLSFLGVFWGVGALSLPLVTSILLKIEMSYSDILSIIGLLALIPVALFLFLKCPEAKNSGGIPYRKYLKMMKNPTILLIGFFLFFQSGFETLTTTWTPKYFMEVYSSSTQNALISLTVMSISLTISRLILGIALKKTEAWKVLVAGLLMTFSGLILMKFGASYTIGMVGIGMLGFGAAASFPVMLGYVGTMFPDISGAAFSLVLVMALTGNMLLNALGGIVFEKYHVASFSLYMMGIVLVMFILLYLIILKLKKKNSLTN
ncbi:MAG: MFS transporter [Bacteroidota bacterium]|nr:MFS transporter [Bacteroidota bacterium]